LARELAAEAKALELETEAKRRAEAEAKRKRSEEWHSIDNPAWWGGMAGD
jgi:hypothetical protein